MTRRQQILITAGTPLLCAAAFLFRVPMMRLARYLPRCPVNTKTGLYCPGCGNTRSLSALLRFDIFTALRENLTMPFLALLLVLFYIETAAALFGRRLRLIPRSGAFWWSVFAVFVVYFIARNLFPAIAPV